MTPLEQLREYDLTFAVVFAERFQRVWGYEVELKKATRGKDARLRNHEVWETMLADRDVLVADVSSWVLGVADKGGILARLNTDEGRAAFGLDAVRIEDGDAHFARMRRTFRDEAFYRHFPAGQDEGRRTPSQQDFISLRDRLMKEVSAGLRGQRDLRLHSYDHDDRRKARAADAKNLSFDAVAAILKELRDVVHDLRLLAEDRTQHCPSLDEPRSHGTARDLVDLVVFGAIDIAVDEWRTISDDEARFLWRKRELDYDALHKKHDAVVNDADVLSTMLS